MIYENRESKPAAGVRRRRWRRRWSKGCAPSATTSPSSQTVANYWLPSRLAVYRSRHPGIAVRVTIGNTETVASHIRDGLADLGLVEGAVDDARVAVRPIADDELVLVVGAAHEWAGRSSISPAELRQARWVMREKGSGTRAVFEAALSDAGQDPGRLDIALELPSNEAVRAAAEAGAGVAVMSSLVAHSSIRAGTVVKLDFPLPKRKFFALRHKERHMTRAARAFDALLSERAEPAAE